jgi:hypothetical protein
LLKNHAGKGEDYELRKEIKEKREVISNGGDT